jgi:transcriptional regulator with XRE-family HTH domain
MTAKTLPAPAPLDFTRQQRSELADFLRTRRARLSPQEVGLPTGMRRKVPGLRREEVAELAGIGTTWYTWLEQRRDVNVSIKTLQQLADALRLASEERRYMFALAGQQPPVIDIEKDHVMLEGLRGMLRELDPSPAYIVNQYWDLIEWNSAASKIFGRFEDRPAKERNIMWLLFTDPYLRKLHLDWDAFAHCMLMGLRREIASMPRSSRLAKVISALSESSREFCAWWSAHDVVLPRQRFRVLRHPRAGTLTLDLTILQILGAPHLKLFSFTPVGWPANRRETRIIVPLMASVAAGTRQRRKRNRCPQLPGGRQTRK